MFEKKEKKYMCSLCDHGDICKYKDSYESMQKRIDEAIDDIFNLPEFIKPVVLECIHFHRNILPPPKPK